MTKEAEQTGAYEARLHQGRLLDEVSGGASYGISKYHQVIAAVVPIDIVPVML